MGAEENLQLVKDAYADFRRGDVQAVLGRLSEDVEFHIPGDGNPLSGTYRGRDAVAGFFQKLGQEAEILAFEPRELVSQGDHVVVIGWDRTKIKSTNRTFEVNWVMDFTVRGNKIAQFREYTDTQRIANAFAVTAKASG